jgi:hypothetical protein
MTTKRIIWIVIAVVIVVVVAFALLNTTGSSGQRDVGMALAMLG